MKEIEIIDGASVDSGEDFNPSLDDEMFADDDNKDDNKDDKKGDDKSPKHKDEDDEDLEELELEDIDDDDDEEDDSDDSDDDDDSDKDEADDEEDDDDDSDDDDDKKEKPASKKAIEAANVEIREGYKETQAELKQLARQFQSIKSRSDAMKKPTAPKEDEYGDVDDRVLDRYERRLATWEDRQTDAESEVEGLREDMNAVAQRQEAVFKKQNSGKELKGFESFIKQRQHYYVAYLSGDVTLEELYENVYLPKVGNPKKEKTRREILKKKKTTFKKVSTKTKGAGAAGGNGIASKYKYANLPAFKSMVKDMKKRKRSMFDGTRFTDAKIDELCKEQYNAMKGKSI